MTGPGKPPRFTALDGLRGIAALVVVIHHSLLLSPGLAQAYRPDGARTHTATWFVYTPLHLVWAGTEAVFVFFVLSGFVLALPFVHGRGGSWVAYYPRRIARLYLPVWGALLVAGACFLMVPRVASPGLSWWVNEHAIGYGIFALLKDVTLAAPGFLDSPLWSLKYEVIFSLLLPAYFLVAFRLRRYAGVLGIGALLLVGVGAAVGFGAAIYLPMFAVGALMAVRLDDLLAIAARLAGWVWACAGLLTALLLTASWWIPAPASVTTALSLAGAALSVFIFLGSPWVRRVADGAPVQWLGKRSFSLYLIHEPIVVLLGFALPSVSVLGKLALALLIALPASGVFFRFVEGPAHNASRAIGRAVADKAKGPGRRHAVRESTLVTRASSDGAASDQASP